MFFNVDLKIKFEKDQNLAEGAWTLGETDLILNIHCVVKHII